MALFLEEASVVSVSDLADFKDNRDAASNGRAGESHERRDQMIQADRVLKSTHQKSNLQSTKLASTFDVFKDANKYALSR